VLRSRFDDASVVGTTIGRRSAPVESRCAMVDGRAAACQAVEGLLARRARSRCPGRWGLLEHENARVAQERAGRWRCAGFSPRRTGARGIPTMVVVTVGQPAISS